MQIKCVWILNCLNARVRFAEAAVFALIYPISSTRRYAGKSSACSSHNDMSVVCECDGVIVLSKKDQTLSSRHIYIVMLTKPGYLGEQYHETNQTTRLH